MTTLADKIAQSRSARSADTGSQELVNRVADSAIETFNLELLWDGKEIVEFDFAPFLYQGLIVREKDFRAAVKEQDWSAFGGKHVAVWCSADTIIPTWAYMLVASKLEPFAASVSVGRAGDLATGYFAAKLAEFDFSPYHDAIVVVKGCNSGVVPVSAYADVTQRLQRVARKLMFGEACSSVPLWRKS